MPMFISRCPASTIFAGTVGVNQFSRFTSSAWTRCWAALVQTRSFEETELRGWLDHRHRLNGENPIRFVGWDAKRPKPPSDYAVNDGKVYLSGDVAEVPQLDSWCDAELIAAGDLESRSTINVRRWLAGVKLDLGKLLRLRDDRRQGKAWELAAVGKWRSSALHRRRCLPWAQILDSGCSGGARR